MRPLVLLAFMVISFVLSGCATPQKRIAERQEIFDTYTSESQVKIRAGQVAPGFTEDMVWMALGDADGKSVESSAEGETVIWVYTRSSPGVGISLGGGSYGGGFGGGGDVGVGSPSDKEYEAVVRFRGGVVTTVTQAADD